MLEHRPFASLGGADHGWLKARHHFSFGSYHDEARTNWGKLRVWNDDEIAAQSGFPPHPHRDMEIITYVRRGAITHTDSLGNSGRTEAGDVQVMSAGSGIRHSEMNLEDETTTLFQIWIETREPGIAPGWGSKSFPKGERSGRLSVLASGDRADAEALRIHADGRVLGATLSAGEKLKHRLDTETFAYLVPATGRIRVNGLILEARDGVAIRDERHLEIEAVETSELLLVETR